MLPEGGRADEAVAFDEPCGVVGLSERQQRLAEFLDRFEVPHPEQVLLQGSDEPLGAAIPFRCSNEGGGAFDAEERDLLLEVVRHVLRAVVMADREAASDVVGEATEVPA